VFLTGIIINNATSSRVAIGLDVLFVNETLFTVGVKDT
jgi:hypothetical protein